MRAFTTLLLIAMLMTSCTVIDRDTNNFCYHPRDFELNFDNFYLQTQNRQLSHTWWLTPNDVKSKGTVLFFHETTHNKSHFLNESRRWVEEGYNILTFDYLSQGFNDFTTSGENVSVGTAAFNYLLAQGIDNTELIIYAQGSAAQTAIESLQDFGLKPLCIILDNPPPEFNFSLIRWMQNLVDFSSKEHEFGNDLYVVPVLVYCTEENESSFEQVDEVSHLSVRSMLPGNGNQRILHSQEIRDEMIEFINMNMGPEKITPEESLQE